MVSLVSLEPLTPIIEKVLSFIPDSEQRAKANLELMSGLQAWDGQQTAIDNTEAANPNLFISGWRPAIGWTCGAIFAYNFLLQPIILFGLAISGSTFDSETLPAFDSNTMMPVLLGMLGLGGMRSFEKLKGVD